MAFIKQIQPEPDGIIYDIAATAANITSITNSLAYYSDTEGSFANSSNVFILNKTTDLNFEYTYTTTVNNVTMTYTATANTGRVNAGEIKGLFIRGKNYGNDPSFLASGVTGVFSFGDPGPQIQFGITESSTIGYGSILYTNHNALGLGGSSFHFLGMSLDLNEGGEKTGPRNEAPVNVLSDRFIAKQNLTIGQNKPNSSYNLYVNGNSYFNGTIDSNLIPNSTNNLGTTTAQWGKLFLSDSLYLYNNSTTNYIRLINSNTSSTVKVIIPNSDHNMYLTHTTSTSIVGSNAQPVYVAENGMITPINYIIEKSVPSTAQFTDTTYTFAGGTNKFTVTPSGGTAQSVTVTPSIPNNVTHSTGTVTTNHIVTWNANAGSNDNAVIKDSGVTISTTVPSSSSTDTTLPTSSAVWSAISNAYTVGNKALKIASNSGTSSTAITVNENSNDKILEIKGDGTYLSGTITTATNKVIVTITPIDSEVTPTSYGLSENATPNYGDSFNVPYFTVDSKGRITNASTKTVKIPVSDNSDEKVKQTPVSNYNGNLQVLLSTTTIEETTDKVYKNVNLQYNPSTNKLSTNNLDLSGTFKVTGATTLSDNVTIGGSLTTNSLTVNGNSQFNNSVNFNSLPTIGNQPLLQALGLSNALHFIGITSTTMVDGRTTATVMIGSTTYTPQIGDVVLYDHREYVWTSTATNGWEMLGSDASIMSAAGTTAINANQGIVYISQDSTGTINAVAGNLVKNVSAAWMTATSTGSVLSVTINGVNTTSAIPIASDSQSGVITTDNQTIAGIKNFKQNIRLNNAGYIGGLVDGSNRYLCLGTTDGTTDTRYIVLNSSSLRPNSTVAADIDLGSSGQPWKDLYALNNYIYNNNKKQVGRFGSAVLGTTTTNGETRFVLGNSTGSGSDNNSYGTFYLYGTGTRYAKITYDGLTYHTNWHIPSYGTSANEDIYFTHTGGTSSVGSDTQPVYVAENGRITTISSINIDLIAKASTTAYGITKLSSATDSTAINVAATPAAVKAAYDAATTAATNSAYAGSVETTSAAKYNTEPEVKSIKITGNTSANTIATNGVVLQYDATLKVLNFVFV